MGGFAAMSGTWGRDDVAGPENTGKYMSTVRRIMSTLEKPTKVKKTKVEGARGILLPFVDHVQDFLNEVRDFCDSS
jgi:hypothetical protein